MKSPNTENYSPKHLMLKFSILGSVLLFSLFIVLLDHLQIPAQTITKSEVRNEDPFERLVLEANSVYVLDIATGDVLFEKNAEYQLPLASLTKIMTAIVATNIVPDNAVVTISKNAINVEGDSGLSEGERWRFKDLIDFTLLVSSNDGARALASAAEVFSEKRGTTTQTFIKKMDLQARNLGLQQSYYLNESGLDISKEIAGGYGSARDIASLFTYAIMHHPRILEVTAYPEVILTSENNLVHTAKNTNPTVGNIPGLIASKTGFTDLAGGNLIIAFDVGINRPVVAVVLGSSFDGRFADIQKLVTATLVRIAHK